MEKLVAQVTVRLLVINTQQWSSCAEFQLIHQEAEREREREREEAERRLTTVTPSAECVLSQQRSDNTHKGFINGHK